MPPFLAIKQAYPNAGVFPNEASIGEYARPGGGQRFTMAAAIRTIVTRARSWG